jgi:hypothetical protein
MGANLAMTALAGFCKVANLVVPLPSPVALGMIEDLIGKVTQ